MNFDWRPVTSGNTVPNERELADQEAMIFGRPSRPHLHPVVLRYDNKVQIVYDYGNPCGIPEEDFSLPLYAWPNSSGGYDIMLRKKEGEKDKYDKLCEAADERSAKTELERYIDSEGKFRETITA